MAAVLSKLVRRIRQVAASELALADKFYYLLDAGFAFLRGNARAGRREIRLRGGVRIALRENSTDEKVFEEIFLQQAYAPYAKIAWKIGPVILVDLGANIGLSSIALARELRPRAMIAVEPDLGNFAALRENLRLAGLTERCTTLQAFAGAAHGHAELIDSGNGAWGMRMGARASTGVRVLPLGEIIGMATGNAGSDRGGPDPKLVLKCDIEGAELQLFQHLVEWEERVHYMILELHTEFLSVEKFRECLELSRYHWRMDGEIPDGAVLAVVGLERMERKDAAPRRRAAVF